MEPTAPSPGSRDGTPRRRASARDKLLAAALDLIRANGYSGTSVEDLCQAAGVTKGAFFHHFESKEALAVAAAEHWSQITGALFEQAPYHAHEDPLDRVLAYIDFRRDLIAGAPAEFTCLVGTMVQECFANSDPIRSACAASIFGHARSLEADLAAAIERYGADAAITAESLARHTQAVLQGAFVLAKAKNSALVATDSVDHLKRYFDLLFGREPRNAISDNPEGTT